MRLPSRKFEAYWQTVPRNAVLRAYVKRLCNRSFMAGYLLGVAAGKAAMLNKYGLKKD